jgi:MFS family permease
MSRFPALAHREFRRYFTGQSIALVGGFAHGVGIAWLGFKLTGSVALLGVLGFAQLAPAIVISPIAGLFADRYSRRKLLIGLLGFVALLGMVLTALTATGQVTATVLLVIAALRGLAFACEVPIRHSFIAELVTDRALLPNAVALHSTALNTARFIGPGLGGFLIASIGEAACLLLHPLSLCAILIQLIRIRTADAHLQQAKTASFLKDYLEGWRVAFSDPIIAHMLIGVFLLGFGVGPYNSLMPATVAELHGAHPELVGIFLSSAGAGAMTAAITLAARRSTSRLRLIAIAGNVSAALGLACFCLSRWVPASMVAMAFIGLGTITQAVSTNMTIQSRVTDIVRGRVMAIYTAMFIGAMPIGSLVFGQLGQWIGASRALLVGAGMALAGAALTAWRMPRRDRDQVG